jgi:O-methyltransferase involved in polyketide biosynthesis
MYDYVLGGKDNFPIDRETVQAMAARFPDSFDAVRANRLFLYRVVRFLARDAGIRQFLDLGSGLPTQNNVHQVAQRFQPESRVVYVDNDPVVLAHGRALLAKDASTTVVAADLTKPQEVLDDPQVRRLVDFSEPVAVLLLSVAHWVVDDATVHSVLSTVRDAIVPGSYLAFSQMCGVDRASTDEANQEAERLGMLAKNRTVAEVTEFLRDLEPVEPELVDVRAWRPDPDQPPLSPPDEPMRRYLGASAQSVRFMEYGGVLRKP